MNRGASRPINSVDGLVSNKSQPSDEPKSRTILDSEEEDYLGIGAPPTYVPPERKIIALELSVPKIKLPKWPYRKIGYYSAATLLGLIVVTGGVVGVRQLSKKSSNKGSKEIKPDFTVVTPLDKPDIAKVQGATSTYDPDKHVLSYTDNFFGTDFTVSQQPLPESFKSDPKALNNLADSIGPKTTLDTQQGTVYLITDPKSGRQTAVLATKKVLLFIRTDKKTDDTLWQDYINKLKTD